jgi:hypothetical protein
MCAPVLSTSDTSGFAAGGLPRYSSLVGSSVASARGRSPLDPSPDTGRRTLVRLTLLVLTFVLLAQSSSREGCKASIEFGSVTTASRTRCSTGTDSW